ncbi:MAG: hypothetical protein JZU65_13710 [Chlorobium sp.]|jgi:hypothetical protein|nr:hypothetical protein [Chlorobium sp.]
MKNIRRIRLRGVIVWIMIQMVVILTIIGALNLQKKMDTLRSFGAKRSGKPGAGKRHAGFDVAAIGNINNGSRTESQNESAGITTEP